MNDPLAIVKARLVAVSAVTALVGSGASARVYAGRLPQNLNATAILLRLIDRVGESHLRGGAGLLVARVQVHHVATTREAAVALANAVEGDGAGSALSHFSGTVSGAHVAGIFPGEVDREQFHAGELLQYEVIRDCVIHYAR